MVYVDASTQTIWAGLTKDPTVRPNILLTNTDTTTPPDEMLTGKLQNYEGFPSIVQPPQQQQDSPHASSSSSLLERRPNKPNFLGRIPLSSSNFTTSNIDEELLRSPPPTKALLSPVPPANKRDAGHTPLVPRSPSPEPQADEEAVEEDSTTPQQDLALAGPLTLPSNPVDGANDHIALDALDNELSRIAQDQERFSKLKDAPEPASPVVDEDKFLPARTRTRHGSSDSRNAADPDGVRLKSPGMNFGAPFGHT